MTGCTLAKADEMRRSLENPRVAPTVKKFFHEKTRERGYSEPVIKRVWEILEGFGSFGFCKAHGAAFALPTYQSAWLKTHFPTEFLAGLFTHDPGMYPKRLLMAEARRLGVKVLPLDVNKSSDEYLVEPEGIRLALTEVQGVSKNEVARIIEEQPFKDIADFYLRVKPTRRTLERLALLGAFDSFGGKRRSDEAGEDPEVTRGDIIARVRQLNAIKNRPASKANQPTLDFQVLERLPTGNIEPTMAEKVSAELSLMKLDVSEHVIELYRPMLEDMGVVNANELVGLRNKTEVLIAGVRVATQTPPMRSGKRVVFISLDDGTGCSDSTFFDEAQARCSHILFNNRLLLISGKTRRTGVRGVSIMAENAWDLRELWEQWAKARPQFRERAAG
jgi:error-prone DNA polymerase